MNQKRKQPPIPSVNYIVLSPCNMKCKYCFTTFQDLKPQFTIKNKLSKQNALKLIEELAAKGFKKITFLGGEPMLCPYLLDLIKKAKKKKMITLLTTNGSLVTNKKLDAFKGFLDWITLSIDTLNKNKSIKIGRVVKGKAISRSKYTEIANNIKAKKIKLRINTVVSSINYQSDMSDFIIKVKPKIWKLIQVVPMNGQNDKLINQYLISSNQFNSYVKKCQRVIKHHISLKAIDNRDMPGDYILIDPLGRLIDTTSNKYLYSEPVLKIGLDQALKQINVDINKFIRRGGIYKW